MANRATRVPEAAAGGRVRAGGGVSDAVLSTVRNAARLLKEFRSREESIGVSELARRLALGKSGVHRLLTTLVVRGAAGAATRTPAATGWAS